jgi:hypothetical protein
VKEREKNVPRLIFNGLFEIGRTTDAYVDVSLKYSEIFVMALKSGESCALQTAEILANRRPE